MQISFVEIVRGIGIVLFITAVAGAIAYVGDRVGHQVGRKRLTLFGIRPRYTSTIIAIGTGMIIALVVTIGAIVGSHQVKLAFFKLSAINAQVQDLQAKARVLESKVNQGQVIVNVDTVMSPYAIVLSQQEPSADRLKRVKALYGDTVRFADYRFNGALKPFVPPPDVDKKLNELANGMQVQGMLSRSNVLVLAASDQNLYRKDSIHFALRVIPDRRVFKAHEPIASLRIPANKSVRVQLAATELASAVAAKANQRHMPPYFLANVPVTQTFPSLLEMQRELTQGTGQYLLTAFAADDIYPHTASIPIVITLGRASK